MADKIKLTIGIITYKRAKYIDEQLTTLIKNQSQDIEFLICDDASPDNTPEVVSSFKDKRIRYIRHPKNIGISENLFSLFNLTRGEYGFYTCDDDPILPGAIKKILKLIDEHPDAGVFYGSHYETKLADNSKKLVLPFSKDRKFSAGEDALINLWRFSYALPGLVIKRSLFDLDNFRKHLNSMYPQVYLWGTALKKEPAFYCCEPFVMLRTDNTKDWKHTKDYMAADVAKIIRDLSSGTSWETRKLLAESFVRSYSFPMHLEARKSPVEFIKLFSRLLAIKEFRESTLFYKNTYSCFSESLAKLTL